MPYPFEGYTTVKDDQPPYRTGSTRVDVPPHGRLWPRRAACFFAPPPTEVGRLRSAASTLAEGDRSLPAPRRAALLLVGVPLLTAVGALLAWIAGLSPQFAENFGAWFGPRELVCGGAALGGASALAALLSGVRSQFRVEYIGEEGVAWFTRRATAEAYDGSGVLPFAKAAHLWKKKTRVFIQFIPTYTSTVLRWTDAAGREVYRITDRSGSRDESTATFVLAAEVAWTRWRARRANDPSLSGALTFPLDEGTVQVTADALVFRHPRGEEHWPRGDVTLTFEAGDVVFATRQADRAALRSRGRRRVPAHRIGDLRLLLVALSLPHGALPDALGHVDDGGRGARDPHPLLALPTHPCDEPDTSRDRLRRGLVVLAVVGLIAIAGAIGAWTS